MLNDVLYIRHTAMKNKLQLCNSVVKIAATSGAET